MKECVYFRSPATRLTSSARNTTPAAKTQSGKDFRIKEMSQKKSQSNFLLIPKSNAKILSSDKGSRDQEGSDEGDGFSKVMSAKASERSEHSIGLNEEKNRSSLKGSLQQQRRRIPSGKLRDDLTPPASYKSSKFSQPAKPSQLIDSLRKSTTSAKRLGLPDLPPTSKKEVNTVSKYPSVRVFPTAK